MKKGIDNGLLLGDLDCKKFAIKNLGSVVPFPSNLVGTNDSRLTDQRTPLDGSVTNSSVNTGAAIGQSKLNFSGTLPHGFLGTTMWTAAQGDLYQPKSAKNQHNGYAGLDANNRLPTGTVPTLGTGTLHSLGVSMPSEISLSEQDFTFGDISIIFSTFAAQDNNTWLGNVSGSSARPTFGANVFPLGLIPSLTTSKIGTGQINQARMPIAKHGTGHAQGLVPDPQPTPGTGQPTDYLARDMTFKTMVNPIAYQPTISFPAIVFMSYSGNEAYINLTNSVTGTSMFYSVNPTISDSMPFVEYDGSPFLVLQGSVIRAYASKAGYNDSGIVTYVVATET